MGEWILIHSIFVYHPTSGLVKQPDIHSYTGHIRTKGHLPQIPGYSPWRENSPNSSWPHTEKHHACHADGSHSHSPSPSTQCTIPPGTATTVPIRDEHSCGCSRRSQPDPDTGSKTLADCDEIPTPDDYENVGGVAPYSSDVSALFEIRPSATVGGAK